MAEIDNNMEDLKAQTLGSIRNDMLEPTKALIQASGLAGDMWIDKFIKTNFILEEDGKIDLSKPMKPRMISCEYEIIKNGTVGKAKMNVPLLSISPTPCVAMSSGKIVHDYEINVSYDNNSKKSNEFEVSKSASGSFWGFGFQASASFRATSSAERKRHSDARAAIHVEQDFAQIPLSEGFNRLQEALLAAANPE